MKTAVIDIGSNSVRLMLNSNGVTLSKKVVVTRLSGGMCDGLLQEEAMERTARAIETLLKEAEERGVKQTYLFATEAVRSAVNRETFLEKLSVPVDVLSGETEAKIGYLGATGKMGGKYVVIDIGGASTELTLGESGRILCAKSIPIGVVRIKENCGEDAVRIERYVEKQFPALSELVRTALDFRILAIGGTALNLTSVVRKIVPYDANRVDGSRVSLGALKEMTQTLKDADIRQRVQYGVDEKRADLIVGGGILLIKLLTLLSASEFTASESDNLEGYLILKQGGAK